MLLILALIVLAALAAPALSRGREHNEIEPDYLSEYDLAMGPSWGRFGRFVVDVAVRGGTSRCCPPVIEVPHHTGRYLELGRVMPAVPVGEAHSLPGGER